MGLNLDLNHPSFFKEIPLLVQVQGNPQLVHFAAGFSKTVDPLSGMTVNLIWIHQWLLDLKIQFENLNFPDFLAALISYQKFLSEISSKAFAEGTEQVLVPAVQMRFFDGSILRLKALETGSGSESSSATSPNKNSDSNSSSVSVSGREQFVFEKSGATVLTEPADSSKTVRVAKVFFKIRTTLDLLQAQEFSIPTSFVSSDSLASESKSSATNVEENFLAELKKKTSLPIVRLEMWDPIRQVAEVVSPAAF